MDKYNLTFRLKNYKNIDDMITLHYLISPSEGEITDRYQKILKQLFSKDALFIVDDFGTGIRTDEIIWFSGFWQDKAETKEES